MPKMSQIDGKRIFNSESNFIGTASDIMIDPTEGKVKFIIRGDIKSILGRDKKGARGFIKKNFIPIERINAIGNIVVVE